MQAGVGGDEDAAARAFLKQAYGMLPADGTSGPGYMFYATAAQKADPTFYGKTLGDSAAFYYVNGLKQPTILQTATAAAADLGERQKILERTINAAAAAGALAILPAAAAEASVAAANAVRYCTLNPGACVVASGVAGGISAGADAAGQAYLSNGTVRTGQTVVAGMVGAATAPLGMNTGALGNAAIGGLSAIANSVVQNLYYGDSNSLAAAGGLGAAFGVGGTYVGSYAQQYLRLAFPSYAPGKAALLTLPNPTGLLISGGIGGIFQGGASFVPSYQNPTASK